MDTVSLLPLFKIAGVFALVVLLLRLSFQVGVALALGAAALGLAFSLNPVQILMAFASSLVQGKTWLLALIVTLIIILSKSMDQLGQMRDLLGGFRKRVGGNRWGLVAFPILIGLLPMPGGAVFSAPMLDAFDQERQISAPLKSFLNYWYRHVWEFWWPLYPAVLLICTIAGLDLSHYMAFSFPMCLVAIVAGLPSLMRAPRALSVHAIGGGDANGPNMGRALLPLLMAIVPGVGLGVFLQFTGSRPGWASIPKEAGLVMGLLAAIGWAWWDRRADAEQVRRILLDPVLVRMGLTVGGVFVFKGVLEQSGAAHQVGDILLHREIPLAWVAALLPMIMGVITGVPIAYVGTSFPILVTLVQAMGASQLMVPFMVLAFAAGLTGHLATPIHLCLILSNEYFNAPLPAVYRYLWLPLIVLMGGAVGYFLILRGLFP